MQTEIINNFVFLTILQERYSSLHTYTQQKLYKLIAINNQAQIREIAAYYKLRLTYNPYHPHLSTQMKQMDPDFVICRMDPYPKMSVKKLHGPELRYSQHNRRRGVPTFIIVLCKKKTNAERGYWDMCAYNRDIWPLKMKVIYYTLYLLLFTGFMYFLIFLSNFNHKMYSSFSYNLN